MPLLKPPRGTQLNKAHPLARGLVGCWLMNEGTGGKIFDLSGNNSVGTLYGDTSWAAGVFGSALSFDGSGDYVNCGNKPTLNLTGDLTISSWIKLTTFGEYGYGRIVSKRQNVSTTGYEFSVDGVNYGLGFNANAIAYFSNSNIISINICYHVAVTRKSGNLTFYVNAKPEGSVNVPTINSDAGTLNIGRREDNLRWFNGLIYNIQIYNRALSSAEIARLYREPFCMFDLPIEPGLLYPAGQIVWLTAASTANSSVYGTLTKHSKLAGIIDAAAALSAILTWHYRGQVERQWLIEALFNGMTANAFKLGTVLTGGWFWMRRSGCSSLYRGPSMEQVDFANILTVAEQDAGSISPPSYIPHHSNSTYFYVVRRFNICGYQERTLAAAAKVAIDANGNLIKSRPNNFFAWRLDQVHGNKIQLIWFYCPLGQESKPESFRIYYDGGTGHIDYENPIATINYQGRKFYTYQSDALTAGRYLFAVRAEDAAGVENNSLAQLGIQISNTTPDAIDILSAEV